MKTRECDEMRAYFASVDAGEVPDRAFAGAAAHLFRCTDCDASWRRSLRKAAGSAAANAEELKAALYEIKFASLAKLEIDPVEWSIRDACGENTATEDLRATLATVGALVANGRFPQHLVPSAGEMLAHLAGSREPEIAQAAKKVAEHMAGTDEIVVVCVEEKRVVRTISAALAAATGLLDSIMAGLMSPAYSEAKLLRANPALDEDSKAYVEKAITDPNRGSPSPRFFGSRFQATFFVKFKEEHEPSDPRDVDVCVVVNPPVKEVGETKLLGVRMPGRIERRPDLGIGRDQTCPWLVTFDHETNRKTPRQKPVVTVGDKFYSLRVTCRNKAPK